FQINGTVNTFKYDGNWFASGNYQAFNFNIDQGGKFLATTGGGAINLNSFSQPVKWTFNKDSQLLFNSMSSSTLLNNPKVSGSSLTLNDPAVVTFNASNANVINGTLSNFPVTINGTGLRTHASATGTTFDSTFDMNKPNRDDIVPNTSDTWYFNNIGTINNLGGSITTPGFAFPYSAADITKINAAKYLSWYKPLGTQIYGYKSNMSRTFNVGLGNLPADGSFSPSISGNAVQNIVVADDRNPKPNFAITLSMVQNNIPDKLNFTWTDPTTSTETPLVLNTSQQIIGTDTNGNLSPAPKSTANAGMNYTFEFATDKGLKVQAKNNLKVQANTNAGTFKYSINSGV
ncbi:MAG: RTX toxin, partial [Streptococcaceae bacterium]|nr:RTX toxin [Streptococcaceae bacterium]